MVKVTGYLFSHVNDLSKIRGDNDEGYNVNCVVNGKHEALCSASLT